MHRISRSFGHWRGLFAPKRQSYPSPWVVISIRDLNKTTLKKNPTSCIIKY